MWKSPLFSMEYPQSGADSWSREMGVVMMEASVGAVPFRVDGMGWREKSLSTEQSFGC